MTTPQEALPERVEATWRRSDAIFGLLAPGALLARPIRLRQPFLFYLGHLPNFAWVQAARFPLGAAPLSTEFEILFDRGIDPPADGDFQPAATDWPAVERVLEYRDRVRAELRQRFEALGRPEGLRALRMVVEHEAMHQETLLYMVHQLDPGRRCAPPGAPPAESRASLGPGRAQVPAGTAVLGRARDGRFGWDNEFPEWRVEVPAFTMETTPVRNREFLEFVEAGGYGRRDFWNDDSWRWRESRGLDRPSFWTKEDGRFGVTTLFGNASLEAAGDWPVYASQAEASAFARWRGGRLPTEAEFHRAAHGTPDGGLRTHPWGDDPPESRFGNFDFARWGPEPVGSRPEGASAWGLHELVGNGWEWTSTPFAGLPGFEPMPTYTAYSQEFFDGRHFVMLGASWATGTCLVRRSFRNWFQPHYPYVFAKFRCVY